MTSNGISKARHVSKTRHDVCSDAWCHCIVWREDASIVVLTGIADLLLQTLYDISATEVLRWIRNHSCYMLLVQKTGASGQTANVHTEWLKTTMTLWLTDDVFHGCQI